MNPVFCFVFAALAITVQPGSPQKNIRNVDFKTLSFAWDETFDEPPSYHAPFWYWLSQLPRTRIHVVKGKHRFHNRELPPEERENVTSLVSVDDVTFGDLDGDGEEEAAVHLNYSTGGTQNWDYLYVYRMVDSRPKLMAILRAGSRGYGGLVGAAIRNGVLILDFADPDRRAGDCCSDGYVRVRYRWRNGTFTQEGQEERGDMK